jgi:outer membrane murein-binding lipoprotein Lpp
MADPAVDLDKIDEFDDSDLTGDTPDTSDTTDTSDTSDTPQQETADGVQDSEKGKPEETAGQAEAPADEPKVEEPPRREPRLPKSRYDFQATKRREAEAKAEQLSEQNEALQRELEELRKAQEAKNEKISSEVTGLEDQILRLDLEAEQLRLDGRAEDAARKQGEIRKLERQIARIEAKAEDATLNAEQLSNVAAERVRREIALDSAVEQIESLYPQLNKDTEEFDEHVLDEVMDLYEGLMANGTAPAVALHRATRYVLGDPVGGATTSAPPANGSGRKKEAVRRNAKVAAKQPPDLSDVGRNADAGGANKPLDIMQMSIEEFEKLDEDQFLV